MPFRIPDGYRDLSAPNHDTDRQFGGDLDDYIAWLYRELFVAEEHRRQLEAEKKKSARSLKKKDKPE